MANIVALPDPSVYGRLLTRYNWEFNPNRINNNCSVLKFKFKTYVCLNLECDLETDSCLTRDDQEGIQCECLSDMEYLPGSDFTWSTPRNDPERSYGHYLCHVCLNGKKWTSGYSWSDTPQQCKTCKTWVYPCHQTDLRRRSRNRRSRKPHAHRLCRKCQRNGDCTLLL